MYLFLAVTVVTRDLTGLVIPLKDVEKLFLSRRHVSDISLEGLALHGNKVCWRLIVPVFGDSGEDSLVTRDGNRLASTQKVFVIRPQPFGKLPRVV